MLSKRIFYRRFFRKMKKFGMFRGVICSPEREYDFPFEKEKYLTLKIVMLLLFSMLLFYLIQEPPVLEAGFEVPGSSVGISGNPDEFGMTRLHRAVVMGRAKIVNVLIRNRAMLDARDDYGWTPLHWSEFLGRKNISALLIRAGAAAGLRTEKDWFIFKKGSLPGELNGGSLNMSSQDLSLQDPQIP